MPLCARILKDRHQKERQTDRKKEKFCKRKILYCETQKETKNRLIGKRQFDIEM
jgi:hypothetical protein